MNIKLISITIALLVPVTTLYAEITELGQCDTPGRANDVFVAGDYAYIADDFEGLTVIDISDPENPEVAGNWDNPDSRAYSVYVVDEIAFISNSVRGIYALDISDLDDINQLGNIQDIGDAYSVLVTGDIACVTSSNRDLSLINISNPQNMNEIGHRSIQGYSRGIYVIENTAFIGQDRQGLYIIDISDPEHPEIIGSVDTPGNARNVHVSGDYACIADEGGGLRIIDISNPENPDEVGSCDFERAYDVFVSDDYAFVTDNNGSAFAVVDISDPEDPEIVESFDIEIGGPTGFEVVDNYAYIAIGSNGLLILDVSDYTFTGPRIELSTDELDFEDVGLNLSRELPIAITNIGNEDLTVSDILIEDDCFSVDFEDELIIEPDEEAEITVTFSPDESGEFEGTMTITSDDEENQEVEVALLGAGVGAVISIHPRALDFGVVGIEHSEERTLTIRNRGLNDLIISAIVNENDVFDTDFEEEISIEPDQREEITVTFTPQIGIDYADTLVISSNDPDNAEVAVPMGGTGVGAIIVVEPDTVQFGEVGLNRIAEAAITIRNIGQLDLNVSDIVVEGGGFSTDFDEEFSIEPEHSRDISVMFTPERSGLCPGILIIASDDRRNDELVVPLFGTGVGPRIAVDQDSLEFGLVSVGRGEIFLVTISAVGLTDLTITDISIDGDYFHTNFDGEEISIQLNHRHQIVVTFEPEDDGLFDGTLTISSDDEDHSQIAVHLNGSAFKGVLSDTPGLARGVFVDGSYAYIADDEAGLRIIGIFNPDAPTDVGGFDTPGNALSVTAADNNVFIADGASGLRIIDVSSPQEPEELVAIETPGEAWDIAIVEDYAYIADGDSGLRVIDIYDLERPVEVGNFDTPGFARAVTIVGNYAYIADDNRGLQIVDISEPEHISEVGSYDTRGWTWDVAVSGEYAYLADERYGLRIIDISDPENPGEVSNLDTDADAYSVTVDGDYAYVADGEGGVCVIHVGDPENPRLVDTFYTPSCAWDVCISGNYAFVADGGHGLLILDAEDFVDVELEQNEQLPSEFILYEVYPNPFNATTTITYGLPSPGYISLSVYDLSGRKIATLINGKMNSGIHKLDWKAVGQTSGVYVVRLETVDVVKTRKVILLR